MNNLQPKKVKIIEVGPRDGLQSEAIKLSVDDRVAFVDLLNTAGFTTIEVGSLVSKKWIPQLADSISVFKKIKKNPAITYQFLVPNEQGLKQAIDAGIKDIALFAAASETFSKKNINCSIEESLLRYTKVAKIAKANAINMRGYVSCAFICPYEGKIVSESVLEVTLKLLDMGCNEISIADTSGKSTPLQTANLLDLLLKYIPKQSLALHMHDTYGQALANCLTALNMGISTFDAAVAGLGGCPYAANASGNLATEDLIFMLHGMNIDTGVNLDNLIKASQFICTKLNHEPQSKAAIALNCLNNKKL